MTPVTHPREMNSSKSPSFPRPVDVTDKDLTMYSENFNRFSKSTPILFIGDSTGHLLFIL